MKHSMILLSSLLVVSMLFMTLMTLWAAPPAPDSKEFCPYAVQKGDTLIKIAARLTGSGKNFSLLMECNNLSSDLIRPGDVLQIPQNILLEEFQCAPQITPASSPSSAKTLSVEPAITATPTVTPIPTLTPPPHEGKKILAEIEGIVFEDKNGNKEPDAGEPGIPGVKVILIKDQVNQPFMSSITRMSDAKGKFLFTHVDPGSQAVGLYEATLPEGAVLLTASTLVVTLTEGDKGYVKFAVKIEKN